MCYVLQMKLELVQRVFYLKMAQIERHVSIARQEQNEILNQCRLFYLLLFSGLVIVLCVSSIAQFSFYRQTQKSFHSNGVSHSHSISIHLLFVSFVGAGASAHVLMV